MPLMQIKRHFPRTGTPLAPYLLSIWRLRAFPAFSQEWVLPKRNVDLLFNLGDPIIRARGNCVIDSVQADTAYLTGVHQSAFSTQPTGNVHLLGVSLRPETCAAILPMTPGEVLDVMVPSAGFVTDSVALLGELRTTPDFPKQCDLLCRWLMTRINRFNPDPQVSWLSQICRELGKEREESKGRVGALAREQGLSERQLRRRFKQLMGIGPAQYRRLLRFERALNLIPELTTLTEVAHAADYHDQAHFCHDFTAFASMPPTAYRTRVGIVPGHIFLP